MDGTRERREKDTAIVGMVHMATYQQYGPASGDMFPSLDTKKSVSPQM
jgi:hypothetical protein